MMILHRYEGRKIVVNSVIYKTLSSKVVENQCDSIIHFASHGLGGLQSGHGGIVSHYIRTLPGIAGRHANVADIARFNNVMKRLHLYENQAETQSSSQ